MHTLCLNMIVKNESKIITRLLESVVKIIDTYCICDTGSTDNTIEIITNFMNKHNIPGKIIIEPFKNFEYNRTFALHACKDMSDYILLLDADMIFEPFKLDKSKLYNADVWKILQGNNNFYYTNVRIIKNDINCKYVGVTHEYISHPDNFRINSFKKDEVFIIDIGDGGSKSDKFERDIKLLEEGILHEQKNSRYYFYLGNSYKDFGNFNKAIEIYLKNIELPGWIQEKWYSLNNIGKCYEELGNKDTAIIYYQKCSELIPDRLENVYNILNIYRNNRKYKEGLELYLKYKNKLEYHINNPNIRDEYLFLRNDVYTYNIFYEYYIMAYYNNIKKIDIEINHILNNCTNQSTINNTILNYKFYYFNLVPHKKINLSNSFYYNNELYTSSSNSIVFLNNNKYKYLMNVRYVNYIINKENGAYNNSGIISTLNKKVYMDSEFKIIKERTYYYNNNNNIIQGLEDIKIFNTNDKNDIIFTSTILNSKNKIGIAIGKYMSLENNELLYNEFFQTFKNTDCEKNWVFVKYKDEINIIYSFYPLNICSFNNNKYELEIKHINMKMPLVFKLARGSSNGFSYNNEIWFIVHVVSYEMPRNYYHFICVFDNEMNLLRYSSMFKFSGEKIEYSLSILVDDNFVYIPYSTWDATTNIGIYNKSYIESLLIFNY